MSAKDFVIVCSVRLLFLRSSPPLTAPLRRSHLLIHWPGRPLIRIKIFLPPRYSSSSSFTSRSWRLSQPPLLPLFEKATERSSLTREQHFSFGLTPFAVADKSSPLQDSVSTHLHNFNIIIRTSPLPSPPSIQPLPAFGCKILAQRLTAVKADAIASISNE